MEKRSDEFEQATFKMRAGAVCAEVNLYLRKRGDSLWSREEELAVNVTHVDRVKVACRPADEKSVEVSIRTDLGVHESAEVILIPLQLALLESVVVTAKALYSERVRTPQVLDDMSRSGLENMIMSQREEIVMLRRLVAEKKEWNFVSVSAHG